MKLTVLGVAIMMPRETLTAHGWIESNGAWKHWLIDEVSFSLPDAYTADIGMQKAARYCADIAWSDADQYIFCQHYNEAAGAENVAENILREFGLRGKS